MSIDMKYGLSLKDNINKINTTIANDPEKEKNNIESKSNNYGDINKNISDSTNASNNNFSTKTDINGVSNDILKKYSFSINFIKSNEPYSYYTTTKVNGDKSGFRYLPNFIGFKNRINYKLYNDFYLPIKTAIYSNISDPDKQKKELTEEMSNLKKNINKAQNKVNIDYIEDIIKNLQKILKNNNKIISKNKLSESEINKAKEIVNILNSTLSDNNKILIDDYNKDNMIEDLKISINNKDFTLYSLNTGINEKSNDYIQPIALWEYYKTLATEEIKLVSQFFDNYIEIDNNIINSNDNSSDIKNNTEQDNATNIPSDSTINDSDSNIIADETTGLMKSRVDTLFGTGSNLITQYYNDGKTLPDKNSDYISKEFSYQDKTIELNPKGEGYLLINNDRIELYNKNNLSIKKYSFRLDYNGLIVKSSNTNNITTIKSISIDVENNSNISTLQSDSLIIKNKNNSNLLKLNSNSLSINSNNSILNLNPNKLSLNKLIELENISDKGIIKSDYSFSNHFSYNTDDYEVLFSTDDINNLKSVFDLNKINDYYINKLEFNKLNSKIKNVFNDLDEFKFNIRINAYICKIYARKMNYIQSSTIHYIWNLYLNIDNNGSYVIQIQVSDNLKLESYIILFY